MASKTNTIYSVKGDFALQIKLQPELILHSPNGNHWIIISCCCQATLEQEVTA